MAEKVKITAVYNRETKRYVAKCPLCPYGNVRSKREAALHVLAQHVAYVHQAEVSR